MASNTTLNPGVAGDIAVTKERAHDGDAAKQQGVFLSGVTGSEGSYTFSDIAAGAGAESAALRVTLATETLSALETIELGATSLAALETIELGATTLAALETVNAAQSGTWNVTNVSGTVSLPTGAATAANQVTTNGHLDGVEGLLTTIDADTSALSAAVKTEDAAHSSGDSGITAFAVRRDADTSLVGADGDYAPLQVNSTGSLKVAITAGAGSGGTSIADGASFTRDTTSLTPVGGIVEASAPTVTAGDAVALSLTTGGAVRVAVASGGIAGVVEDAAAAGGEEGVLVLAVRRDSASSGVGADGDFAALSVTSDGSLRVSGSSGTTQYTEDGASAGGEALCLVGALRRDTAASSSGTDGDYSTLNTDANGRLHTIAALAASQTLATVTNVVAIGTSVTPGTSAAHLGKAEDAAHASGDTGVMSLAVRTDTAAASSGTTGDYEPFHTDSVGALWSRSTGELADDAAFTPGTSRVLPAGFTADEASTDSVDEGDVGAARMTLDRKQIVAPYAHAAGGATPVATVSAASTNATSLKGSAGTLYSVTASNVNAAIRYLKFYNKATAPTVGTDTPVYVFPLPGNTAGAGVTHSFPLGLNFSLGIAWALTVEATVAGTTGVSASEHVISIAYV